MTIMELIAFFSPDIIRNHRERRKSVWNINQMFFWNRKKFLF